MVTPGLNHFDRLNASSTPVVDAPTKKQSSLPLKRRGIRSFFTLKEPSTSALLDFAESERKKAELSSQRGGPRKTPSGVSSQKLPGHVPKVNSKWDGLPECPGRKDRAGRHSGTSSVTSRHSNASSGREPTSRPTSHASAKELPHRSSERVSGVAPRPISRGHGDASPPINLQRPRTVTTIPSITSVIDPPVPTPPAPVTCIPTGFPFTPTSSDTTRPNGSTIEPLLKQKENGGSIILEPSASNFSRPFPPHAKQLPSAQRRVRSSEEILQHAHPSQGRTVQQTREPQEAEEWQAPRSISRPAPPVVRSRAQDGKATSGQTKRDVVPWEIFDRDPAPAEFAQSLAVKTADSGMRNAVRLSWHLGSITE